MKTFRMTIRTQRSKITDGSNGCFSHCKLLALCLDIPGVSICNAKRCIRMPDIYVSNFIVLGCERKYD